MNEDTFITSEEIVKKQIKKTFIFGTGVDSIDLIRKIENKVDIIAFVDNFRFGSTFFGKKVISRDDLYCVWDEESVLIIASYRYALEIIAQISDRRISIGKNCYIWDDAFMFHTNEVINKYIEFNIRIWNNKRRENSNNIVAIVFENYHNAMPMIYSYFANNLAEKYDAEIWAFPRRGISIDGISPVIKRIYKSINVSYFVDAVITDDIIIEADCISERIWKSIESWSDWNEIEIFEIEIGTAIVRYLTRFCNPDIDANSENNKVLLYDIVRQIVYWYHFFENNPVKVVLLKDGVTWEAIVSDIANSMGIPVYALQGDGYYRKAGFKFLCTPFFQYYGRFWNELSDQEKKAGYLWAKHRIDMRLKGSTDDIPHMTGKSVFSVSEDVTNRVLCNTAKTKLLILPHIFGEESYQCGEHIFDNNFISWLCHLGELSEKYTDYEWYLKKHPNSEYRDDIIIGKVLKRYKNITLIPTDISPMQLKREGLDAVLTVYGTAALEYAAIGIIAITAGVNPFSCFNFCVNPKNKEEYDLVIERINTVRNELVYDDIYKYYAVNYLYYDWEYNFFSKELFINQNIAYDIGKLPPELQEQGTWKYEEFLDEWTLERHKHICAEIDSMFERMDEWKEDYFYKKKQ